MSLDRTIETALAKALGSAAMREGMGALAVGWMRRHLYDGKGADGEFQPLKEMQSRRVTKRGKETVKPWYRNSGKPLVGTGALARSLDSRVVPSPGGLTIELWGLPYGGYHDSGFSTNGPNYIPLTRKGSRGHATGANPSKEGLRRGWDYLLAMDGVTVPARPFLAPDSDDLDDLAATVCAVLKTQMER